MAFAFPECICVFLILHFTIDRVLHFRTKIITDTFFKQDYLGGNGVVKNDPDNRWLIVNVGYSTSNSKLSYSLTFQYTEYIGNVAVNGDCHLFTSFAEAEAAQLAMPSLVPDYASKMCFLLICSKSKYFDLINSSQLISLMDGLCS